MTAQKRGQKHDSLRFRTFISLEIIKVSEMMINMKSDLQAGPGCRASVCVLCPCLNSAPDTGRVQPRPPPATQLLDSSHINREKVEPSVGILFIFKNIAIICPGLGLAAGGGDVDTAACWKLHHCTSPAAAAGPRLLCCNRNHIMLQCCSVTPGM